VDVKSRIKEFILTELASDAGVDIDDFSDNESLIDIGVLDSLGMLKLIAFLDEEMNTSIMAEDFNLDEFETLELVCGWVEKHGGDSDTETSVSASAPPAADELPPTTPMPTISELKHAALDPGLKDRVVLVTGSSRGLGETIAKLFSIHGSRIVVNYGRNEKHARRVADEIEAAGGKALVIGADVSDANQVSDMITQIVDRWGRIDVLVNNAAGDAAPTEFAKVSWDDVQASIDIVVKGAFNCCKAAVPVMLEHGGGRIINVGTLATDNPAPNQLKYVLAKSALVGLTRSLAVDYAGQNIQVNVVCPSVVETDLIGHIPEAYRAKIAKDTPLQRNATPQDVAQAVVFLASRNSSFTTGQKIMVTGGIPPFL